MMIMTTWQGVITIIMAMLGTMLTRFLPFLLFPESKEPPRSSPTWAPSCRMP